jgi:4-oxalocrotonate tautomerase
MLSGHCRQTREEFMPLSRISLRRGKTAAYRRAVMDQVYEALRETFDVPEDDRFMLVTEHDEDSFSFGRRYLGIDRSDDLVIIQITVSNTRTIDQKKRLYKRIVERLVERPGVRPQDVFVNLLEVGKENWSFGNGEAQYV